MSEHYILDEKGEPKVVDLMTWARWFERGIGRLVGQSPLGEKGSVSTVFLGLDHRFGNDGPPILWETMIFGGPHDGYQERYSSKADAVAGHAKAVMLASGS